MQDIFEIHEVRESSRFGEEYLKSAREEFFRENYENAMEDFESSRNSYLKAKKIFSGIEILELEEIEEFIQKCKRGLEAELAFKDGESFLESGDYESSKESFLKALEIFDELSNEEMVLKVRERLEEIENRVGREKEPIKQKVPEETPEEEVSIEILIILTSLFLYVLLKKIKEKPQPLYTVDEI